MYDLLFEKNKILVTGGSGRFGKLLIKKRLKNFVFPSKRRWILQSYPQLKNA